MDEADAMMANITPHLAPPLTAGMWAVLLDGDDERRKTNNYDAPRLSPEYRDVGGVPRG